MNRKVSSNFQSYNAHITTTTQPKSLFNKIIQNNDYQEGTLSLLYSLVQNHPSISTDVIPYLKSLDIDEYECNHWIIKICFLVLEKTKDTAPIDIIVKSNFDITIYMLELINNENKIPVLKDIISRIESDKFVSALVKQMATSENVQWLKNAIVLFVELDCEFDNLEFLIESEHYFLRNGYLEYISKKVVKGEYDYLNTFYERLSDLNYNVRSRVLQILGNLYNGGYINTKMSEVLEKVMSKIHDKTVIVRKKAICFCSNYLIVNDKQVSTEIDVLYTKILQMSMSLLKSGQSSEISEILHLIKLSYYYNVTDSKNYFEECFDLVWDSKNKIVLLECIKEITDRIDPVSFFYTFASEKESYSKVLQSIRFKKIWVEKIIANLVSNENAYESSIILSNVRQVDVNHTCLSSATKLLFSSDTLENLERNCFIYNNILTYVLNNKLKKCKCASKDCQSCSSYEKVISQIYRNVSKMNFCNFNILDTTVKILFKNTNLERNISYLLSDLMNKGFVVQTIYGLGVIADEISNFLDKSENKIKRLNVKMDDIMVENREKRASISRLSTMKTIDNTFIQQSFIDNTVMNDTMANNTMLKDLNEKAENNEIGEYIFYVRENVLFKSNSSIFYNFLPIITTMLNDTGIGHIAHQTMYKFMRCSSELFLENIHILENGLKHADDKIRNVSLFALSSFLISYSAWVDSYIPLLFDAIQDANCVIKTNALLIINYLYAHRLLRIKGFGHVFLAAYLDESLKGHLLNLIAIFTENDLVNVINQCMNEDKDFTEHLLKLITNEKVKEGIVSKIKKGSVEIKNE